MKWNFAYLMPNALFNSPVEHGPVAIVRPDDARLLHLRKQHAVAKLISSFQDQFGRSIETSAVLIRDDAPTSVDFYAVASFRNIVAMCSITDAWIQRLSLATTEHPHWADYFDFYPFTALKDGNLGAKTIATHEIDRPNHFCGQRHPHLPSNSALTFGLDAELLSVLFIQWDRKFTQHRPERKTSVLFRSLEIARRAMQLPAIGTGTPTIHDIGVGIALWVSAFEVLTHPKKGNANLGTVLDLLSQSQWSDATLKARRYSVTYPKSNLRKVDLPQKLYSELYRARNDFLHGNRVTATSLYPSQKAGGRTLIHSASLVYRAGLIQYTKVSGHAPNLKTKSGRIKALSHLMTKAMYHSQYEKALLACKPPC